MAQCNVNFYGQRTVKTSVNCLDYNGSIFFEFKVFEESVSFTDSKINSHAYFNALTYNKAFKLENVNFNVRARLKSEFKGAFHLDSVVFLKGVNFGRGVYNGTSKFHKTFFHGDTELAHQSFNKSLDFSESRFFGMADFSETKFDGRTFFDTIEFDSTTLFRDATFSTETTFFKVMFNDDLSFFRAKFSKALRFFASNFRSVSTFQLCEVDSILSFNSSNLGRKMSFNNAKVNQIDFNSVILPDTLLMNSLNINKEVNLLRVQPPKNSTKCVIDLRGTSLDKINMRYDFFKLFVPDSIDSERRFEEITNVYEGLLKNFKDKGYLRSYEKLDKEYQAFKYTRGTEKPAFGEALNWINYHWNDYGYDKTRIWPITFFVFLFFFFFNWLRLPHLVKFVYKIPSIDKAINQDKKLRAFRLKHRAYPRFNFFSTFLALYYTGLVFFGLKIESGNMHLTCPWSVAWIFFQYVVGLICLAYLANFVITTGLIGS